MGFDLEAISTVPVSISNSNQLPMECQIVYVIVMFLFLFYSNFTWISLRVKYFNYTRNHLTP